MGGLDCLLYKRMLDKAVCVVLACLVLCVAVMPAADPQAAVMVPHLLGWDGGPVLLCHVV
jgi:hypothetical protein